MLVALPGDDIDAITREIIVGNDWVADQLLIREIVAMSYDRLLDIEAFEVAFPKSGDGTYIRRPTRGLDQARIMHPAGGGLELCWRLRRGLEAEGVQIIDRVFVTGLMRGGTERVVGATGIHSRSGAFFALRARVTIVCTNAITFRSGFVRDITGTGTLLAYKAGARLRNAEFSYTRPSTPNYYFEGITMAIQDGARFVNERGDRFMREYEPIWGDEADVPRIARAMAIEKQRGNAPVYLDMSAIPQSKRGHLIASNVKWMAKFFSKLSAEARLDMFQKTPYYPLAQMTKMGVRTDRRGRSDVDGLLAAGLAQAGCANHFAGFHIGFAIGSGWIAGRSAVEDLDRLASPNLDEGEVRALHHDVDSVLDTAAEAQSDRLLRQLQTIMFRYDVAVWKSKERLEGALEQIRALRVEGESAAAPHTHELVRLKETEAMLLAAEIMLEASLLRTESRLSHFREDFDARDDDHWLCWLDIRHGAGAPQFEKTPIPTPLSHPDGVTTTIVKRLADRR